MEGPISFWGYKEKVKRLILHEHDDDDDDNDDDVFLIKTVLTVKLKMSSKGTNYFNKTPVPFN
jgi:hypothetical protein